MTFILLLLVFLTVIFWIVGRRNHNHEFVMLSYIFALAAFGVGSILFLAVNVSTM